jgi:transposase
MKNYGLFIGIDISKDWFDAAISEDGRLDQMQHKCFDNTTKGFVSFLNWVKKIGEKQYPSEQWLFCMEHTGIYTMGLSAFLHDQQLDYVMESALRIKRSLGIRRGKSDKADSKDIARYAYLHRMDLVVKELPIDTLLQIKHLLAFRNRLIVQKNAIKVPANEFKVLPKLDETITFIMEQSQVVVQQMSDQIKQVENQLKELIKSSPALQETYDLLCSVKGIGKIVALNLMVHTNNFRAFQSSRQLACYVGIAPFEKQSGKTLKQEAKVSKLGHKKLKALLTNSAMAAVQHDAQLKKYYKRKIEEGKNKFSVLNAVKNKIIARAFAVVRRGTPFVELDL